MSTFKFGSHDTKTAGISNSGWRLKIFVCAGVAGAGLGRAADRGAGAATLQLRHGAGPQVGCDWWRAGSRDPELTSDWSRSWSSCGPGVTVEEGGVAPGTRADIAVVAGAGQPAAHQSQVSRDWRRQVT